jgi:hypothetical protein
MSADAFIISVARNADIATALQQALELSGVAAARVEDAIFGLDGGLRQPDAEAATRKAGLSCPIAVVAPSLRALFFAAASVLDDEVQLSLAVMLHPNAASAILLASAEAVGRLNLFPRARIAAQSLSGKEPALRQAGLSETDVEICRESPGGLLPELLDELDARPARWGLFAAGELVLLIERL